MSSTKSTPKTIAELTEAQRKALAASIVKARSNGQSWDGDAGIVNDKRFPLISSAGQGRKLLREAGKAEMIAKSYEAMRDGSPRKGYVKATAKPAAKKAPVKKTAAKPAAKRTRKPAAK